MSRYLPNLIRLLVVGMLCVIPPVQGQAAPADPIAPGTRRMAERLEQIIRSTDPLNNQFMSRERAARFGQMVTNATDPADLVQLQLYWAQELLVSGQTDAALRAFDRLLELFQQHPAVASSRHLALVRLNQATAYLRQGMDDNCLTNHNADSCLFPIRGGGALKFQRGPRRAIALLTEHLNRMPSDLRAHWLLNLAYMYVGEYPDKVPPQWRIDPQALASEYDIKRFPDVAPALGLAVDDLAGGSVTEDFDGDGHLDIMASSFEVRAQLRLFRNNGDGTFTERTREAGLIGEMGGLNLLQADYNNDGHPDVLVLRGAWLGEAGRYPNSLLRNNGDGTFADVTEEAGLLSFHPTQTAVWLDYNHDGWLDLFIGNESGSKEQHPCELYRNNGDGTFTECAARLGVDYVGFVKAVVSGDFNNDGRPDLFLSVYQRANVLYRNDGPRGVDKSAKADWQFTDVAASAGVTAPIYSFPSWFWDFDNDGWEDLFVVGYLSRSIGDMAADYLGKPHTGERPRLYRNNRDGTFSDVTRPAGLHKLLLGMGVNYGDLDNDGFLDCYVGTGDPEFITLMPNRMFRNADGKVFQDVTTSGGFGHLQKGHGVSFADLDNDGDQDIHVVMGGAYTGDHYFNLLFENPGHGNRWITLKLEGVKSNRAALGARIKVVVETSQGDRTIYKTVSTGGSFGASPLRQEIGLGQAKAIRRVEIFWPVTGQTQTLTNLVMNRFYRVKEDSAEAVPWELKSYKLASGGARPLSSHAGVHRDAQ